MKKKYKFDDDYCDSDCSVADRCEDCAYHYIASCYIERSNETEDSVAKAEGR